MVGKYLVLDFSISLSLTLHNLAGLFSVSLICTNCTQSIAIKVGKAKEEEEANLIEIMTSQ